MSIVLALYRKRLDYYEFKDCIDDMASVRLVKITQ